MCCEELPSRRWKLPLSENSLRGWLQTPAELCQFRGIQSVTRCLRAVRVVESRKETSWMESFFVASSRFVCRKHGALSEFKLRTSNANRNYCNREKLFPLCHAFPFFLCRLCAPCEARTQKTKSEREKWKTGVLHASHVLNGGDKKVLQFREQIVDEQRVQHWRSKSDEWKHLFVVKIWKRRTS